MTRILKWWPVVVGVIGAVVWLVSSSIEISEIKSETKFKQEAAASERSDLGEEDIRIYKRIDKTDKRVSKLRNKTQKMQEGIVRMETNQTVIIRNQSRMLEKLEQR
tara:strand:- start:482 stop:799 length:318 start_codon:yes stop_codon:yes gene_type:complete